MKKSGEEVFVCKNCGNEFNKWSGVCPACKEWNSLVETSSRFSNNKKQLSGARLRTKVEAIKLSNIKKEETGVRIKSKLEEFDRVVGGGLVPGGVTLFAGEPGIGKSTLVSQLVSQLGGVYVGGEESASQIGRRLERLKLPLGGVEVLESNRVEEIVDYLNGVQNVFELVVVDSIQVLATTDLPGGAGSVAQIRECTLRLVEVAKRKNLAMIIVGHVTKEGDIAGPKMLEHMVDTVVYLEGDKTSDLRILRCYKNRFGATDEVGVFKMTEKGMVEVRGDNLVMSEEGAPVAGSSLTIVMDGTRPMLLEVQALVVESFAPQPRRVFSGIAYDRGQLMAAVAQKILNIPLYKYDLFLQVTGGIKIADPAADLAVVAAIWSSFKGKPLDKKVFIGEVSLLGKVKAPRNMDKREKEAKALGKGVAVIKDLRELK